MVFAIPPRLIINDELIPAHLPGLAKTIPLLDNQNKRIYFYQPGLRCHNDSVILKLKQFKHIELNNE
jgi:hypothetical protein